MVKLKIEGRGIRPVLYAYRSVIPKLAEAQQRAGKIVGDHLKTEASQIIREKAPRSSGRLSQSLYVSQDKLARGWKTTVSSTADYAKKVESGANSKLIRQGDAEWNTLLDWVSRVLGSKAHKTVLRKRSMTVRRGRNPFYDTSQGMRFFQIPVERNREYIDDIYRQEVNKILSKVR